MRGAQFESREVAQAWVDRKGSPPLLQWPTLTSAEGRAVLAATRDDPLVHASAALMLLAGLRPQEVSELRVRDYVLGERRLHVDGVRHPRIIRIAPSAAAAVDAYLEGQDADPGEPLLVGLQGVKRVTLFAAAMRAAELDVRAHDLRRSAMGAVLEDGAPVQHLEAYFGITKSASRKDLVPVRDGYDEGIAAVLESAFAT
ncbi:tyrosine-type recombinase/integrase [Streptomyces sp. NBC_01454]|uniref:tyrosine-type recombinase/integrase n=1 Tax=Streptomyces sp. NBC_01454 TaxID=2975867 RepID=UPI002E33F0C4|nr:tyrosine-type recombinase/integrase [Streptomyces sp. NBC_01454]